MKNSSKPMQENPSSFSEPLSGPVPPWISRGSFDNVRFSGRHVGASMIAEGGAGETPGSCSINIYINNDIQGITNSVLIGSDMTMGDPGASLILEDLKLDRGFRMVTEKKERDFVTGLIMLLAFVMLFISFLAYSFV